MVRVRYWSLLVVSFVCLDGLSFADAYSEKIFISDATDEIVCEHTQSWGGFGLNVAAVPQDGRSPIPLSIAGKDYSKGLGSHAQGEIVVPLDGKYLTFSAEAGVQWQGGHKGSVVFCAVLDGKEIFKSRVMSDSDPAVPVELNVKDGRELRLIADDAGDGWGCDMANWANACLHHDPHIPYFGRMMIAYNGKPAPAPSQPVCDLMVIGGETGPQTAVMEPAGRIAVGIREGEDVVVTLPMSALPAAYRIEADAVVTFGNCAGVWIEAAGVSSGKLLVHHKQPLSLRLAGVATQTSGEILISIKGVEDEACVEIRNVRLICGDRTLPIPLRIDPLCLTFPVPSMPNLRPSLENVFIEWDWRMQDGIGTSRAPVTWTASIEKTLMRGDAVLADLQESGLDIGTQVLEWEKLRNEWNQYTKQSDTGDAIWEDLWRRVHEQRRRIVFQNPLSQTGPLIFVKQVPALFSHQLTQYYGRCARAGGGIYVLDRPGASMHSRRLVESLPEGSCQHPEISFDGTKLLFAYCQVDSPPEHWRKPNGRFFHLYEMNVDGTGLKQLTHGDFDDFAPRYLPNGQIVFISTRRLGFHRCGAGPCPVYTLALAEGDGSNPHPISFHETNEWDPAVLPDGRILYTRWDYVDRNAVFYQQLWTVRPDGSDVRIFYGNNTFNPVGVWEAKPVPGSHKIMATAAAHHAMTAGSIILMDISKGVDGLNPIERVTPDALFPESEYAVNGHWYAPLGVKTQPEVPIDAERWPGHCYRSAYPLSEKYFLAAYSYVGLRGEPNPDPENMFGLYWVDVFGNKELLYRDLNLSSLWPVPVRPRPVPPLLSSQLVSDDREEGVFFLQNVYDSWPDIRRDTIHRLRVIQVLPKSTPNANEPRLGLANISPGKQVLGTVPVESDGSAYFRVPADLPLLFQALDDRGQAVQMMRSVTYMQKGETISCIGCHEHRTSAPPQKTSAIALRNPPTTIEPGPEGSNPFSYPLLVQPILDRHCVSCHGGDNPAKGIRLNGEPEGEFSVSYNALAPLVPHAAWGVPGNSEPLTLPDSFGARASRLMKMLREGHQQVQLTEEEMERLTTWMDANALFYGTFDPEDQRRQQRGEWIAGPKIE